MTLQDLKFSYVLYVLVKNDYVKSKTAKELDVSLRGLQDVLKKMKAQGYQVSKGYVEFSLEKNKDPDLTLSKFIMPDNKERIAYRDWLLNADYMRSMTKRSHSL